MNPVFSFWPKPCLSSYYLSPSISYDVKGNNIFYEFACLSLQQESENEEKHEKLLKEITALSSSSKRRLVQVEA